MQFLENMDFSVIDFFKMIAFTGKPNKDSYFTILNCIDAIY